MEAKYGSSFFDAEVVEVAEDGKVKIKWGRMADGRRVWRPLHGL